ncbi:MAG TPA: 1-phosphofructokinase [Thermoanaerobaculia bacterium]|nr:1-phosphofructokinase [Thermoanaerobaculia bacterium]
MIDPPVVTVTLNPAIDQTLSIPGFAAGRVNRVAASRSDAGGKGVNVACVLADLGLDVVATGFLGSDNTVLFETLFEQKRIADRFVRIPGCTRVGLKIVDDETQQTTDINFPGLTPTAEAVAELLDQIASLVVPGGWFVLSGSLPAGAPDDLYATLIDAIHDQGGGVVLDTSGRALREALASAPEVMKPNVEELSELAGRALDTTAAVRAAAESLLDRGVERVVVSMGAEGALFVDRDKALLARPPKVPVRSTVGAGDAMVAGIVYAMSRDLPLEDVARTATASGAYAVTRIGAGIEDRAEHRKLAEQVEIETFS